MMKAREKVPTGIQGLDEMLYGGIPRGNSVLLAGPTGSGKTTIGMEFLYRGASIHNENGLFVSFEEDPNDIVANIPFDWMLPKLISERKIAIIKYDPYRHEDIIDTVRSAIKEINAKRLVIDSLTALSLYIEDVKDIRRKIMDLNDVVRNLGCTSIYIGEIRNHAPQEISRFGVEEFISSGLIVLMVSRHGSELVNSLVVKKMRGSPHDKKIRPYKFGIDGIVVYSKEEALQFKREDIF
jgi:KaiC/GvpD/RAD55 family RecA-like ATPase